MAEDSGFFSAEGQLCTGEGRAKLIYRSRDGWTEIRCTERDGRILALKSLKEEYRGKAMYESLLRKEFEIASSLSHPGIREVYALSHHPEFGNTLEMEWIEGCTLEELLLTAPPCRKDALRLAGELCDAVSYIHDRQILHRDIKPENVMITSGGGKVKLIDFGLSDADRWAILKGAGGTRSYSAPELMEGGKSSIASDIWSLGTVVGRMIKGKRRQIAKCLNHDPGKRWKDASEFKEALQARSPLPFIALAAVLSACLAAAFFAFQKSEDGTGGTQDASIDNPEVIDELFRQATQMIEDQL